MSSLTDDKIERRIREICAPHIGDLIRLGDAVDLSPWSAESYLAELKNPDAVMLRLISEANKTVGFVVGRLICTEGEAADAEIYNIAVKEAEQRKGNGQLLFDAFAEKCRQRHVLNIWLEVRESNEKAIAFYMRNGFERVQRRSHFYDNPREHAWVMRSVLKY